MKVHTALSMLAFLFGVAAASGALAASGHCDIDSVRAITPPDAVVDSVTSITAPVAHCQVLGHIITTNPGPNRVEWSVMLPDDNFNGRYYFIGEGAAAGFVPTATLGDPLNAGYVNTTLKLLEEGFAVAGSDTGHKGMMWDFGIGNPAARVDHNERGAHVSAVATQAITRAYYGMTGKLYRYHLGCSGGGRMGAMAVLHHPDDYDGVVVSTGFGDGGSMWFPWILQHLIAHPESWISPPKLAMLEHRVAEKCAGPDGLVRDPGACGFDPASVQCKAGVDQDDCLTAAQVGLVRIITGPYPTGPGTTARGYTLTNPTGWTLFLLGATPPTNTNPDNPWAPAKPPAAYPIAQSIMRGWYFDNAKFDLIKDFDFNNPADRRAVQEGEAQWSAVSTNISAFKRAGGKLILWAGIGENGVPPATEIDYYTALKQQDPGTDDFVRLYLAPGVWHCGGGIGPQDTADRLLEAVIAWAEQGKRPDAVVAVSDPPRLMSAPGGPPPTLVAPPVSRTVLLCPYPQTAAFNAKPGSFAYDANNWICK